MKITYILFLILVIMSGVGGICEQESQNYNKWINRNEGEIIEDVISSADKNIDLGCVLLILAKEYYPSIDVKKYLDILDNMAREIEDQISAQKEPSDVIRTINSYLFDVKGFKASPTIYWKPRENYAEKALLNKVLDNKSGNCLGLSSLYLALAERLNLPVYGVSSPEHIFIRYDNGKYIRDIETDKNGAELGTSAYDYYLAPGMNNPDNQMFFIGLTKEDINFAGYLKNLSKKDVIGIFLMNRGMVYYDNYDDSKSDSDWRKAIKVSSNPAHTHFEIASFLAGVGTDGAYNRALFHLNEVIRMSPNYYGSYELKGYLINSTGYTYDAREELKSALSVYSKAIELNPSLARIYYRRAVIYEKINEYDNAIKDIDRAIKLFPSSDRCHLRRAKLLFYKSDNDNAIKELTLTIQLNPKYSEAYYFRGLIYKKLGKKQEAIKDFTHYLELEPKSIRTELVQQYIEELKEKTPPETKPNEK
ncbi:MAG: tetratricopeptide repeat protein [Planctomycetota bacterium]